MKITICDDDRELHPLLAGYIIDVIGAQIPDDKWEQIKLKVKGILA